MRSAHWAGQDTEIVDLRGRAVIPGLIDAHLHVIRASEHWSNEARFDGVLSGAQALARVKAVLARVKPGEWVFSLYAPAQSLRQSRASMRRATHRR